MVVAGVAVMVVLGAFAPVGPDLGWQLLIGRRLLQGDRLYVDIAVWEVHPPLYTWLATAWEWLGGLLRLPGSTIARVTTTVAAGVSVAAAYRLSFRSPLLLATLAAGAIAVAGGYIAGGEQLAVLGLLPYLAAAARSATGARLRPAPALLIGLAAGLGMALKPPFALVWLLVEGYLAGRRGWRSFLRIESATIVGVGLAYAAATALLTPRFFTGALESTRLYLMYSAIPRWAVAIKGTTYLVLVAVAVVALCRPRGIRGHLAVLALLATAAMWLTVLQQSKAWEYQWIPTQALALLAIAAAIPPRAARWLAVPAVLGSIGLLLTLGAELRAGLRRLPGFHDRMRAAVTEIAPGGPILALTDRIAMSFPLVYELGAEWSSPYVSLWMVKPLDAENPVPLASRSSANWSATERQLFDNLWRAIEKRPPRVIVLEIELPPDQPFDFPAYFRTDPRLRALLDRFEVVRRIGAYEILRPKPAPATLSSGATTASGGIAGATGRQPE